MFIKKMSNEKKDVYHISNTKKLIDINDDVTNFEAEIIVRGTSDFLLNILSQTELDNAPKIEYKKIKGIYRDFISNRNNIYQNYFLILKSDQPQDVEVIIKFKELPKIKQVQQEEDIPTPERPTIESTNESVPIMLPEQVVQQIPQQEIESSGFNWRLIFFIAIGSIVLFLVYKYVYKNKKENKVVESPNIEQITKNISREIIDNIKTEIPKFEAPKVETNLPKTTISNDALKIKKYKFVY